MKKLLTLILFSVFALNVQFVMARETQTNVNVNSQTQVSEEDYNFNDSSVYLTDEQLQDAEQIDEIDDKDTSFIKKIINSSHFSSDTATKTWIPINKVK